MENITAISWKTFKDTLLQHPALDLQFQYADNKWVDSSYHITEIKQAPITSVDCGGIVNNWTEVIMQLYEPENGQQLRAMKVAKALNIVNVVEKALPLNPAAIVKIEFGNSEFDTRQLLPGQILANGENLVVDLRPDAVQCKAMGRGGSCDTSEKQKAGLKNSAAKTETCCVPGGGCC
jgi:hypothetical protein